MKNQVLKGVFTVLAVCLIFTVQAQAPSRMSFQAVLRNSSNALVTNATVGMRISILKGSATGNSVYTETQNPQTNANGLVSLEIGGGTVVSGNFSAIIWAEGPYFIKTETDPVGGTNYTITGTQQMLSVPFALYAERSGTSASGLAPGSNPGETPYWNGSSWKSSQNIYNRGFNVGINTATPNAQLQVNGGFCVEGTQTTHAQGAYLEWNKNNGDGKTYLLNQRGLGAGGFVFGELNNANAINTRMTLDSNGTTLGGPSAFMDMKGHIRLLGHLSFNNPNAVINFGSGTNGALYFRSVATQGTIGPGINELAILTADGRYGLGTTNPGARMEISSPPTNAKTLYLNQPSATWGTVANFNNYRYLQTNFGGASADGNVKQFNVGAGGVSIGYPSVPSFGSGDALYVNGNVGIGTASPTYPLSFPANLGKKISLYPGNTGDAGLAMSGNRLQIYSDNPNADIALGYDVGGTFNERFAFKPNGAVAVNGTAGNSGQVLTSNGSGSAASWKSPSNAIYQNAVVQNAPASVTVTHGNTIGFSGVTHTFTLTGNAKVMVNFSCNLETPTCGICQNPKPDIYLLVDGVADYNNGIYPTVPAGQKETASGFALLQLGAGAHTIALRLHHNDASGSPVGFADLYASGKQSIIILPE